jgi:hypothetical protein
MIMSLNKELIVNKILIAPIKVDNKWWVNIEYKMSTFIGTCDVMFETESDALALHVGCVLSNN